MNSFVKYLLLLIASLLLLNSCEKKTNDYDWGWDEDDEVEVKPRYIWVDAAANFPDFANSKENIIRDLKLAKESGFSDIVVDVRPTSGDVLYKTSHCEQVKWLGAWTDSGFKKFERTVTWDYLETFIEEGHKLDLKIHAGFNTFPGGHKNSLGEQGILFRDSKKAATWATQLNIVGGIQSIMTASDYSTKFFNPVYPEVQEYLFSLLVDLAKNYPNLDGIILDRGRFDGFTSDFSPYTRSAFEDYIGKEVENFPVDILPVNHKVNVPNPVPKYFKQWVEFRAKTIHDFMTEARKRIKAVNSDVLYGVYVGGWYGSYYDVGVNWASPSYNVSVNYPSWATLQYQNFGYADQMDHMLIGAYASPGKVYGTTEWTMQGFCLQAKNKIGSACPMVIGGPDVGNWDYADNFTQEQENEAITLSVDACYNAGDGYFLFDMIHLKKANQWQYVKEGIQAVLDK